MPHDVPVSPRLQVPVPACPEPFPAVQVDIVEPAHDVVVADLRAVAEPGMLEYLQGAADPSLFEPWLTAEDVAASLHIHPRTVIRWAREGKIPGRKWGRTWRFRASSLDAISNDGVGSTPSQSARVKE